ncbi:MAG: hypothetical protein M3R63_17340 [Actinomycetota bacterium]|nr:hypothetical protein [Actinomycetota bacterium]
MSRARGGAMPVTQPVGWVFLDRDNNAGYTIRWRRGDSVAYILAGQQMFSHQTVHALDTIPVSPSGWTDLAEIRLTGERWQRPR